MMRGSGERGEKEEMIRKGPWKKEEDEVLISHVEEYGPRDWSSIRSKGLLQRTGKSCRLRWVNKLKLNPELKNESKFSQEEKREVLKLQAQLGNKWARIAEYFPGRTDNDVKNYFWCSTRKKRKRLSNPSVMKSNGNNKNSTAHAFEAQSSTPSRRDLYILPPQDTRTLQDIPQLAKLPVCRSIPATSQLEGVSLLTWSPRADNDVSMESDRIVGSNEVTIPLPRGLADAEGVDIAPQNHVDVGDQPRVSGLTERSTLERVIVGDAHDVHSTAPRIPTITSAEPRTLPNWLDQSRPAADRLINLVPWGRGLHVRPEAVPYLNRVRACHGDIFGGVTIDNKAIVSILAEDLARLLCLMEQYTCVNIPPTHQEFLSKHLKDCTSLGVDVSWLVSRVDSMTAMSKLLKGKEAIEKIEKTIAELSMD